MSLLFRSLGQPTADELIRRNGPGRLASPVSSADAMRSSAVWASLRLRADLISTSPVDTYRKIGGRSLEVPKPLVLVNPGGSTVDIAEWLYSTQVDLDRFGNAFGLITAIDGLGFPARIDLLAGEGVTVRTKAGVITEFRSGGKSYDPAQVWHEKQFTVAGIPVGLSPIAYAALPLRAFLSAQQFAAQWFDGGAVPAAHLKNTAKTLDKDEASATKERFTQSVSTGDVFVTGSDWDYKMLGGSASDSAFIEAMQASGPDICRFFGVPADMVDFPAPSGAITYASITQRNLQLLIMNLGPAVARRERALSKLLPKPRFVKLNTDAVVLSMDPKTRAEMNAILLTSKQRTPSEVREKDDLAPYTPEQIAEIQALAGQAQQLLVTKESA